MKTRFMVMFCFGLGLLISSPASGKSYKGKKILYIDSYHVEYPWSSGITRGVQSALEGTGVQLKIIRMDTKRNPAEESKRQAALEAKAAIEIFKPHVVIASDDEACKYLVMPYYRDATLPFVFCGVDWDTSVYGFPYKNVTGMVEVHEVSELIKRLRQYSKGDTVGFLGEDTPMDRKEVENYKTIFNLPITEYYATSFDHWKGGFKFMQGAAQILIHSNYIGFADWDPKEAARFAVENSEIPSGAFQEDPMDYTLLGYLKVPEEQGEWAAKTALRILDGTPPSAIPITRNKMGRLVINARIAEKLGIEFPYDMLEAAYKVIE